MKNVRFYLVIAWLLAAGSLEAQQNRPNITDPRLDFSVIGINGDSIRLSSLKGNVLLIDFWASWCGPCRISNRQLIKLYNKYKGKGFEIFGVSIDEKKSDWLKAIAKDKITWLQGNDPGGWDAQAAIKWQVDAIPASFLVDKKGNVVAVNLEKNELEKMIEELLKQ